jgi:hypothetical protein
MGQWMTRRRRRRSRQCVASLGLLVLATCGTNDGPTGDSGATSGAGGTSSSTGAEAEDETTSETASTEDGPSAEEVCRAYCEYDIEMCVDIDDGVDYLGYCYQDCAWYSDVDAECDQGAAVLFTCLSMLTCDELDDFWGEVGEYPCKAEEDLEWAACPED